MSSDAWVSICSATGGCVAAYGGSRLALDGHVALGIATALVSALVPLGAMFARRSVFEKIRIIANADRKDWSE